MTAVVAGNESERRVAEALRARSTGAGWPGPARPQALLPHASGVGTRTALVTALLGGAVLGMALALLSLLVPGLLPPLG